MTETEWLRCRNPFVLLVWVRRLANGRRWRLFNVACCRRVASLLGESSSMQCLESMEAFADYDGTDPTWPVDPTWSVEAMHRGYAQGILRDNFPPNGRWYLPDYLAAAGRAKALGGVAACGRMTCEACWESLVAYRYTQVWSNRSEERAAREARSEERVARAHLVREIFGN